MQISEKVDNKREAFEVELIKDVPGYKLKKGHKLKVVVTRFVDQSGYQVYTESRESFHVSGTEEKILETIKFLPTVKSN